MGPIWPWNSNSADIFVYSALYQPNFIIPSLIVQKLWRWQTKTKKKILSKTYIHLAIRYAVRWWREHKIWHHGVAEFNDRSLSCYADTISLSACPSASRNLWRFTSSIFIIIKLRWCQYRRGKLISAAVWEAVELLSNYVTSDMKYFVII